MSQPKDNPNQSPTDTPQEFCEQTIVDMVAAFYRRVRVDDLLGPLYPDNDWDGAEERLKDFLVFRFGGSDRYIRERGHPRLRMRHAPFKIGVAERDRWIELMNEAIQEANVPKNDIINLQNFFGHVANFLRNQDEGPASN